PASRGTPGEDSDRTGGPACNGMPFNIDLPGSIPVMDTGTIPGGTPTLLPLSPRWWAVTIVVVVLLAGILCYDYRSRCHGKPSERVDALRNATSLLQSLSRDFSFGDPAPSLVEEQYDSVRE